MTTLMAWFGPSYPRYNTGTVYGTLHYAIFRVGDDAPPSPRFFVTVRSMIAPRAIFALLCFPLSLHNLPLLSSVPIHRLEVLERGSLDIDDVNVALDLASGSA